METEQKEVEFKMVDSKDISKILFILGSIAVIIGLILITTEILEGKKNCNSLNGTYSLKIYPTQHLCNNQNFSKYSTGGWDFDSNKNYEVDHIVTSPKPKSNFSIQISK